MKKKILAIVTALCMALTVMPLLSGEAHAASSSETIKLNTMYSGTTKEWRGYHDGSYVVYTFKTSARKDSKYKFYAKATSGNDYDDAHITLYHKDGWEDMAYGDGESVKSASFTWSNDPVKLKPNTTYKVRVYGEQYLSFTGGIPFKIKVSEIVD